MFQLWPPGMKGVKLHFGNAGITLRDSSHAARVREVFRLAERLRVPVLVHMRARGYAETGTPQPFFPAPA